MSHWKSTTPNQGFTSKCSITKTLKNIQPNNEFLTPIAVPRCSCSIHEVELESWQITWSFHKAFCCVTILWGLLLFLQLLPFSIFPFLLSIVNLNPLEVNHTNYSALWVLPLPFSCLSACNYYTLASSSNPLSPYKAKCLAADVPQISGLFFSPLHSDGLRLISFASNDVVPWNFLTWTEKKDSLPLNIALYHKKQWYSDKQLQKKMSGSISVHIAGWWNMIPSSHFPPHLSLKTDNKK